MPWPGRAYTLGSMSPPTWPPGSRSGLIEPGNIDLSTRPRVLNPDGTISTIRSMSVNIDGNEVLIPTVSDAGELLTQEQAIDLFQRTGRHLGKFDSPENATRFAEWLSTLQGSMIGP
jgi:hypothetical protein